MAEIRIGRFMLFFHEQEFQQLYLLLGGLTGECGGVFLNTGERDYLLGFPQIRETRTLGEVKEEKGTLNIYIYVLNFFGDYLRPVTSAEDLRERIAHTLTHEIAHVLLSNGHGRALSFIHNGIQRILNFSIEYYIPLRVILTIALLGMWFVRNGFWSIFSTSGGDTILVFVIFGDLLSFVFGKLLIRIREWCAVFLAHRITKKHHERFLGLTEVKEGW